ncbi:MAG: hypothetical protein LBN39_12615 [Planctomycetaceae bacterium]|jgi:hypothetical protein|nr:hypothetical protein [Planctomycetaceae bacterium]
MTKRHFTVFLFFAAVLFPLLLLLPMFPAVSARAQQPINGTDPYKELDEKINIFFEGVIAGNTSSALENLLLQSPLGTTTNSSSSASMKTRLDEARTQYGSFIDYEPVKHIPLGKDAVLIRYLLKCDNYPLVWTFTYYRKPPQRGTVSPAAVAAAPWQLIEMRFDTNLELLAL